VFRLQLLWPEESVCDARAAAHSAGQSNRIVTMWDKHGRKSEFGLEIWSPDALPSTMCTVSRYENDVYETEATNTTRAVRSMHGFLVSNGESSRSLVSCINDWIPVA
jgi:hypothetical protein